MGFLYRPEDEAKPIMVAKQSDSSKDADGFVIESL